MQNAAFAGIRRVPQPVNEPNKSYAPGSPERADLKARLKSMAAEKIEIPLIIGGREIRTGRTEKSVMPHDHAHVLAEYHVAGLRVIEDVAVQLLLRFGVLVDLVQVLPFRHELQRQRGPGDADAGGPGGAPRS